MELETELSQIIFLLKIETQEELNNQLSKTSEQIYTKKHLEYVNTPLNSLQNLNTPSHGVSQT